MVTPFSPYLAVTISRPLANCDGPQRKGEDMKTNQSKNVILNQSHFRVLLKKRIAPRLLLALLLALLAGGIGAAQTQESERLYVISKEGRRYPVEPAGGYRRRLAETQSQLPAEKQSAAPLRSGAGAAPPASYSLAQYQTPIKDQT